MNRIRYPRFGEHDFVRKEVRCAVTGNCLEKGVMDEEEFLDSLRMGIINIPSSSHENIRQVLLNKDGTALLFFVIAMRSPINDSPIPTEFDVPLLVSDRPIIPDNGGEGRKYEYRNDVVVSDELLFPFIFPTSRKASGVVILPIQNAG